MSSCNVETTELDEAGARRVDDTENAILDAAAECVLAFGVRRTSLSDVARRAGVSRPTVYRRWPDRQALVADVMTREFAAVFSAAGRDAQEAPWAAGAAALDAREAAQEAVRDTREVTSVRERAVARFLAVARQLRSHPLLTKIIQVDPELLQTYIFDRLGASQRMALEFIAGRIRAGQRDGSIRAGDEAAMSVTVLLSIQSLVFSGRTTDALVTPEAREAEATMLLDRYLSPGALLDGAVRADAPRDGGSRGGGSRDGGSRDGGHQDGGPRDGGLA
jgi:AcrR family transcriptional regulator